MKKKVKKLTAGAFCLTMLLNATTSTAMALTKEEQPEALKIGILSDTHYFSKELYSDCDDFNLAMNSDRKMLKESSAILDASLDTLIKDAPDVVMISGDLTKDGEEINHRAVAKKLKEVKQQLPETQIYVINGNHDINNPHGKDFSSGNAVEADTTTVEEFKEIYKDFGYGKNTKQFKPKSSDAGSLSYVTQIAKGYTLIAVDSCKYSADQTASGTDIQETGGVINEELLQWVQTQAQAAKAQGDVVFVLEHHGVVPHFSQEPNVMKDYLVDNYGEVSEAYANAGVSYVFTGHMHANDISEYTSSTGNKLYDIETGSLVTYPSLFRSVTIQSGTDKTQDGHSFVSEMKRPSPVTYTDFDSNETVVINDLTTYGKVLTLSKEVICTMINEGVLSPMIDTVVENDGIKSLIAYVLQVEKEEVTPTIVSMVTKLLPQTKEEGIQVSLSNFQFVVYYNPEQKAIMFDQVSKTYDTGKDGTITLTLEDGRKLNLTLPQELQEALILAASQSTYGLFDPISLKVPDIKVSQMIDNLFIQINENFLATGSIQMVIESFVGHLLEGMVDDTHTVFDVVETVYQMHLAGNEQCEVWLEEAIEKIKEGHMLPEILKQAMVDTQPILKEQLKTLSISLGDLVEKGNDSIQTGIVIGIVKGITLDGSMIIDIVGDLSTLIPMDLLKTINDLAYNVAFSMSHDENFSEDLNTNITIEGMQSWDEPITTPIPEQEKPQNQPQPQTQNKNPSTGDTTTLTFALFTLVTSGLLIGYEMYKKQHQ